MHERGGCLVFEAEGCPALALKVGPSCIARASPFALCTQCVVRKGCGVATFEVGQGPVDLGLFIGEVVEGEGDIESAGGKERSAVFAVSVEVVGNSWFYARFVRRCGMSDQRGGGDY